MVNKATFDKFTQTFIGNLPPGLKAIQDALGCHFEQSLKSTLDKLELVTREEFDVQCQVLAKTRAKLDQMQARLDALAQAQDKS